MKKRKLPEGLYGITPEWDDNKKLINAISEAARGGMKILQLRRKKATYEKIRQQAIEISSLCKDINIKLIINDYWKLAIECKADGFHLGLDDFNIHEIKNKVELGLIVGTSCYNDIERARILIGEGVSYVAFGSVFQSTTKPFACHMPLEELEMARKKININSPYSIVAIGGINIENIPLIKKTKVNNIAVLNGLFESRNIFETAKELSSTFI